MLNPSELLGDVARILDELGIPYVVGGSFASSLHGEARFTRDADIVVELPADKVEPLARALMPRFYVSTASMREAIRDHSSFNAIHPESGFKIDFFILGDAPFDREEFRRRMPAGAAPTMGPVVMYKTPEDTILRKLQWFRAGGEVSEQQWKDVLGVLGVCRGRLDEPYLDRWAAELRVTDLLAKARDQARV